MTTRFTAALNKNFSLYLSNKDTLYKLYKLQIIKTDLDYIACLHLIKAQKSRINYQVNRIWRQHRRCNVTEPFPVENTFTLIRKFESKMFPHISPQSLGHLWFCIFCFVLTKRTKIALIFGQILTNQLHLIHKRIWNYFPSYSLTLCIIRVFSSAALKCAIFQTNQLKIAAWPWNIPTQSEGMWQKQMLNFVDAICVLMWSKASMSNDSPPARRLLFTGCTVRDCICNCFVYWMWRVEEIADSRIVAVGSCRRLKHNVRSISTEL